MVMGWIAIIIGYFLGAIPTAYIAGHLIRNIDIRQMSDGNIGAANAFRNLGSRTGVAVFLIDASKGALTIFIARALGVSLEFVLLAGLAAVIGHNWPVFLHFRGGKGFSTIIGIMAAVVPLAVLILTIPTLAALFIKRNTAAAGIALFIPLPLICWFLEVPGILIAYSLVLPCLLGFTNLIRRNQPVRVSEAEPD
ncbi:glycerol-3-phosphate acyltransferase [Chloroflexota bacterium]